uniref:OB domain-containing protein n=1 Tax=Ciona savignyi TaxID=51511 RepID=H2Z0N2_CIOSA
YLTQAPSIQAAEQPSKLFLTQQTRKPDKPNIERPTPKKIFPKKVFLSVNVHGLKRWSGYKEFFCPTFEIMGTVDSEVTETNQGKSFILKDGQGGIVECIYFESSEYDFVHIIRDKRYRCVGCYDTRS